MKKIILPFLICLVQLIHAQVNPSTRKEYQIEDQKGHSVYTNSNTRTTLVFFYERDKRNKEYRWFFDLLNEDMLVLKHLEFTSPSNPFDEFYTHARENHFYLLTYSTSKGKFEINDILMDDLSYKTVSGEFAKSLNIQELTVLSTTAFISAKTSKDHQIFVVDIPSGKTTQVIPKNLTEAKLVFDDAQVVSEVEMAYKYKVCSKEGCEYYVLRFDAKGKQLGDFIVVPKPDEDREITYISISKNAENSYFITGTFSAARSKKANGIFFSKMTNGRIEYLKYHNFLNLTNFTNYLSDRRQDKLERKKAKKEEQGEELFVSYNVVIHDVVEKNGEYIFIGEFYFPTYRTETYYVSGPNGTSSMRTRQVFDGYQYSHAALAGFDQQGNLSWSNTFEMWLAQKPFSVKKFIRKNFHDDMVDLIYLNNGTVKSVSFRKDRIVKEESNQIAFETDDENDKVKRSYDGEVKWWYDRHYLNTGRQVIKNEEKEEKKRNVYYVSKVSY